VRLTAQLDMGDGMVLVPTASVAWEHEFLDASGEVNASFAGSPNGTSFDIVGSEDEADAAVISLGIALTSDNMTAFVGYDGRITGDASAHQGTIGIRFGF
jgi:outer membrane autotransporter protein